MVKLSVIVCTRNRAGVVVACLDSIVRAIAAADPVKTEIIVVNNASVDETASVLKEWADGCTVPLHLLQEPKKGVSRARNLGACKARGEFLAFIDDDCRLSENYVTDLLRHASADSDMVLRGGKVELGDPSDLPLTIKTESQTMRWHKSQNSARHSYLGGSILGCNMTMSKALFDRLGQFDKHLGPGTFIPGSEDSDYIFRAYYAEVVIEYVPDMTVYHFHGRKELEVGRRLLCNYMTGAGALYVKYIFKDPNLCRAFGWDVKNALREILSGKNTCRPEIGMSHKHKVIYSMLGSVKYLYVLIPVPGAQAAAIAFSHILTWLSRFKAVRAE